MSTRVHEPEEAERLVAETYLPNRLDLGRVRSPLAMALDSVRVGTLTAGLLTYGRPVKLVTEEAENFHINIPLRGQAISRSGADDRVPLAAGHAGVFGTGAPAEILWSDDCVQLCLMVPRSTLESTLERLLGEPIRERLRMEFVMDLTSGPGQAWWGALRMLLDELAGPAHSERNPMADRHVEAVVLDRLLLAQHHNYTEVLRQRSRSSAPSSRVVNKAVELMQERPEQPWTIASLAAAVHVSVRTLQQHFRNEIGTPPMTYLRDVRLKRVRETLEHATGDDVTVRSVATSAGLLHQGRFAALYRDSFGESPSTTLRRPRDT